MGVSYRRDSLGNWIPATDSAQPNLDYRYQPGIHGWDGLEKIDVDSGEQIEISPVLSRVRVSDEFLNAYLALRSES